MRTILIFLAISLATGAGAQGRHETANPSGPDPNRSVAEQTLSALEAEGIIDPAKEATTQTWMRQLALQRLGKTRMRRIYLVMFSLGNGEKVQAVAETDESRIPEERGIVVYVVSKILQPDGKPVPPKP